MTIDGSHYQPFVAAVRALHWCVDMYGEAKAAGNCFAVFDMVRPGGSPRHGVARKETPGTGMGPVSRPFQWLAICQGPTCFPSASSYSLIPNHVPRPRPDTPSATTTCRSVSAQTISRYFVLRRWTGHQGPDGVFTVEQPGQLDFMRRRKQRYSTFFMSVVSAPT